MDLPTPTYQSFDQMLNGFASEATAETTPPAAAPAATPPTTPPAAPPAAAPAPTTETPAAPPAAPTATAKPTAEPPFDPDSLFGSGKQNAAFAQMRTANTAMQKTLNRIAQTLGVEGSDPESIIAGLNRRLNEHQSTEQGIPLEMLERMDKLTQDAEAREREFRAAEANRGFQRVKDEFKLDDAGLRAFAVKLHEAGKNPFEAPMDLVTEYKILNYEALLTKAKEEAANAALLRQQHGQQHSTQPSTAAPAGTPGSAKPVNSVQDLEVLLKDFQ